MAYVWHAVGACILPNVGGWVGSFAVAKNYNDWYKDLKKPSWNPPKWVFAPVWTGLYTGMGYASFMVWKEAGGFQGKAVVPLSLYAGQLALNWAWTPIFFGAHSIKWGLVDIIALTGLATATAIGFSSVNRTAGLIMAPYVVWLAFATSLNLSIYQQNLPAIEGAKKEEKKDVKK